MKNDYTDRRICAEEVAEYLGVSKGTTRNWIMKHTIIPTHKIGKQWGCKRNVLDSWNKVGDCCFRGDGIFKLVQEVTLNEQ